MNDLTIQNSNMPVTIEDLSKFVLVGREKLNAVRAEIRAIDRLQLAEEVRNQKREEAQMLSAALLDAEARLGELFKLIPKGSGGDRRSGDFKNDSDVVFEKRKKETINDLGFSMKQAERFGVLADNQDIVEQVKREAVENDDYATRGRVIELAKARRGQEAGYYQKLGDGHKVFSALNKSLDLIDDLDTSAPMLNAMLESYDEIIRLDEQVQEIRQAIDKLFVIKRFLEGRLRENEKRQKH